MKNYLVNYLNKRMEEDGQTPYVKTPGPVITISREVGCGGLQVSHLLAAEMNKIVYCKRWQVISKEILNESAQELQVAPEKVERLLKLNEHFTFDEILSAFTDKYYKSNRVILNTVREVIHNFAIEGYCIILGRASHIIASDIRNALHIRLVAPTDWRVSRISASKGFSRAEALQYIKETDIERDNLRKCFLKDKNAEDNYDLVIDVSRFSEDMVVRLIAQAFELRGIGEENLKKFPYF
ncbi:MAG: AAA family ATPase [Mangrovibacterium sp.]